MKSKIGHIITAITMYILSFLHTRLKLDIIHITSNVIKKLFYQVNTHKIKSILQSEKIVFFDIGSRGGIDNGLDKYRDVLDIYVSDADATESEKLSNEENFHIINKGIGQKSEDCIDLYLCKSLLMSSVLKPSGKFLNFYKKGKSSAFKVTKKEKINTTNISNIFKSRSLLDLLKIDVQGYELEVIKGFGKVRPLLIETEISFVPLYEDSATFFELGKKLYDMGYILFHSSYKSRNVNNRHVNQIPVHGDAWFIPDWTRKKGVDIIKGRERKWEALMLIYGMEGIFNYAISEIKNN
jgi:FkbM family methyltransferase